MADGEKNLEVDGVENEPLVLDLVEWVAERSRPYEDVMEAWRTSCPRLTIWEDAVDAGFLSVAFGRDATRMVSVTDKGRSFLEHRGRARVAGSRR